VKASPEDQAKLLDLGHIDTELARTRKILATLPAIAAVKEAEAERLAAKEQLRLALEDVDGFRADVTRAESDVELVDQRIARDQERLQSTTSPKDAQGLEHELETLATRRSLLEDVQLDVMEKLETALEVLATATETVAGIESRLEASRAEVASETAAGEATIAELTDKREQLTTALPADLVALYERQRERYGHGVSELRGTVSSASGVQLTESDVHDIRQAADDDVVLCPDSNAILVRSR
jgi:predicted  nucleic acid-binding Zn-ribbon protein